MHRGVNRYPRRRADNNPLLHGKYHIGCMQLLSPSITPAMGLEDEKGLSH